MLERMAGQEAGGVDNRNEGGEFDFQISHDFMEDWDLVMSDVFNFDGHGVGASGMDTFLT